jgi:hypothetical protein
MDWMRISMTSRDVAAGRHMRLQEAFEGAFMAAAGPMSAAMFENDPSPGEYAFYFSPGAVDIFRPVLATYRAIECEAPPAAGTSLLVGDVRVRNMLAPRGSGT